MGQPIVPPLHNQMPPISHLARPMVALKYLWIYAYKIKKIEIVEAETGNKLKPRNMKYLEIHPIESKYWILFSDGYSGAGLPLPIQDIQEISKKLSSTTNLITRKKDEFIEISFVGNKTLGHAGTLLIAAIRLEDEYIPKVYELLRLLKQLQYDSRYWLHHSLYSSTGDSNQTVDIYPNAPYLADGEEMCWQSLVYESVNNEEKISQIDAVTNYRIFQYDYRKHHGSGILIPQIEDNTIVEERPTAETRPVGSYFIASYNLTGIKEAGTTKIIGDVTFNSQDKSSITFTQITDPEMLSTAVRRLKTKQTLTHLNNKYEINDLTKTKTTTTTCGKCNHGNTVEANFCNKCGNPLAVVCNKCGRSNTSGSLFCSQCGNKI